MNLFNGWMRDVGKPFISFPSFFWDFGTRTDYFGCFHLAFLIALSVLKKNKKPSAFSGNCRIRRDKENKMKIKYLLITLIVFSIMIGCGEKTEEKPDLSKKGKNNVEKNIPVMVEKIQPKNLEQFIKVTGKLEGWTDIVMTSETSGKIIEIKKRLGDRVAKGEEIGRIDNRDYEIQLKQSEASVLAAEASYESAELQMQASENLFKQNSISQVEYSQSKSAYKNALAGLNGAQAGLEKAQKAYDNSRFIAPVSGFITDISIEIGQTISFGQPVCSIVDSKKMIIKTGVGEKEVQKLQKGQQVTISNDGKRDIFYGKITGIGIKPVNNSASYPIEIEIDNPKGKLLPGMVIEASIQSKVFKDVIYTSMNNIIQEYDDYFAFVITKENKAERRKVTLGEKVGENVIITSGIKIDEKLVIEGVENLEDGSVVDIRKGL